MKEEIGKRIQWLREKRGFSQAELAVTAGVPLGSLKNYEQGIRLPTLPAALRLSRTLGTTVEELAGDLVTASVDSG